MASRTRARLIVLAAVLTCVGVVLLARPLLRGQFVADIEMVQRGGDPIRLGMHGGVGPAPAAAPVGPAMVAGQISPPFEGPTPEEKAAIDNLRAATHEQWTQMVAVMEQSQGDGMHGVDGEVSKIKASEPEIHQPLRHLTPYEIAAINNDAESIHRSVAVTR